jgi:hypothetical protein
MSSHSVGPEGTNGDVLGRLPYEPPHLGRVRLEADQVLGLGCKTAGQHISGGTCATGPCGTEIAS